MQSSLRDFLYLDIEKVRSLLAQALEGVPEQVERSTAQRGRGDIKVLQYAYERSSSETASVHHHLYGLLEDHLRKRGGVIELGEGTMVENWQEHKFADGRFLLACGHIRLTDFRQLSALIRILPRLLNVGQETERRLLKRSLQAGEITKTQYNSQVHAARGDVGVSRAELDNMAQMIQELYGDAVILRLYPFAEERTKYFVATLAREYLQRRFEFAASGAGVVSSGVWRIFGIVDRFTLRSQIEGSGDLSGSAEAVSLEDAANRLLASFAELSRHMLSVEWPVVALTPLAIYREV